MPAGLRMRHPEPSFTPMAGDGPRGSTRPGRGEGSCRPPFCALVARHRGLTGYRTSSFIAGP
eukprot:10642550-Alexandrium_andersonii.AAC.1